MATSVFSTIKNQWTFKKIVFGIKLITFPRKDKLYENKSSMIVGRGVFEREECQSLLQNGGQIFFILC